MKATEIRNQPYPCKDCICVPICKHKNYTQLIGECDLIFDLLYKRAEMSRQGGYRQRSFKVNILKVEEYLKPTTWETSYEGEKGNLTRISRRI